MHVVFVNNVSKDGEFCLYNEPNNLPNTGDHFVRNGTEWIVQCRVFDYDTERIKIFIRKANNNDVTYN